MRFRRISTGVVAALALGIAAPAHAGVADFVKKVFKVAMGGEVSIPLPGPYPLGPTPIVLRSGKLTVTKKGVTVQIKLTALGAPLCTATLSIDAKGVSLDCDADFKFFRAHLGGYLDFDFKNWGVEGSAAFEILGRKIAGAHIELTREGFSAGFTILGIHLSVGPLKPGEIWAAIKKAALAILNPYELAKKAAKVVAAGAKKVAGAVADGAKAVGRGAKAAARKVGSVLSSGARALFGGGGSLMDAVKKLQVAKIAETARKAAEAKKAEEEARERKAKIAAMCEAIAGRIVRDNGLDKAAEAAAKHPAQVFLRMPPFNCNLGEKVESVVRKVRDALAKVGEASEKIQEALKPSRALEEAKSRGLVKFYRCSVVEKKPECADLWPALDPRLRELAAAYAAAPPPKKRTWKRRRVRAIPASHEVPAATKAAEAATQVAEAAAPAPEGRLISPPLPATAILVQGLGFRTKPDIKSPFVFRHDKYIEAGQKVRVTDILGEPGKAGAFCQVKRGGKLGFIRCDGPFFRTP
jgi:hypothetical protein